MWEQNKNCAASFHSFIAQTMRLFSEDASELES